MNDPVTVRDIPEGTYWMKDEKDRWLIRRLGSGELLSSEASLRRAIEKASAAISDQEVPRV